MREAGVAEKNRTEVQSQRDRELKKGGKVTRMEEEAKELEKVVTKLRTQAEIKGGTIKDEEAARDASGRELSEVCDCLSRVRPALSLVGYPDEVAEAIAFVFSDTLICDDAASAQAVTFAREVGVRSVTLDGDVYEPGGTTSGVLMRAQELCAAEERVVG